MAALLPRWLRKRLMRLEADIDTAVETLARETEQGSRILDAGAGECRHRKAFERCRYVGVDLGVGDVQWDYSRLDAVADLSRLPFADNTFGAVLSIVVLEHTREPAMVVREMARVLRPGGKLLLIVPQEWAMHQVPHDYFRFTRYGVESLLTEAGLRAESIAPVGGFFTVLGRRLIESALFFQGGWRYLLFPLAALLCGPAGILLPSLDRLDRQRLATLGYVCLAIKRN